jgi:hypothetical protein
MRGTYQIPGTNLTLANQPVTLVFVNPGVDASLKIVRAWCTQAANATSAQQRVQMNTQVTAFPTLVSQAPEKTAPLDGVSTIVGGTAGAAGTSGVNASAEGAGSKTVHHPDAFNVLNGWLWVPTPEEAFLMSASLASGFGLHFPAAPATLTAWNAGLVFSEL